MNRDLEGGVCAQGGVLQADEGWSVIRRAARVQRPLTRSAAGIQIRSHVSKEQPFGNHGAIARSFGTESLENGAVNGCCMRLGIRAVAGRPAAEENLPSHWTFCAAKFNDAALAFGSRRNDSR